MEKQTIPQGRDGVGAKTRMFRLRITGIQVAKELRRTPSAISRAINEDRPILLARIHRYLDRMEREKQSSLDKQFANRVAL